MNLMNLCIFIQNFVMNGDIQFIVVTMTFLATIHTYF
jgi:hypothetical protein